MSYIYDPIDRDIMYPVYLAKQSKKSRKKKKKRHTRRPIALNYEQAATQLATVDPAQTQSGVVAISMDDAWDCAPSISWTIMYFMLIGMVAVSMRFYPEPLLKVK